ncbi:MAG: PfkB family carbohydrate kinase [Actinomycetota bacterium]|nr:PfkB family carbohydrate kinase [Actinomycetota bacterium]MEA2022869.1 PfkB family carbohydrate kinase [Actinomycetota bacterium]
MNPRIGVVGGLNMDIHLFGGEHRSEDGAYLAERYIIEPGGKGSNQARAAARLGADALLVGCVGDDEFGRLCVDATNGHGVDTTHVVTTSEQRTGFVVIQLIEGRHRSLVFTPGANSMLSWDDVAPALDALAECDVVITQSEVPTDTVDRLIDWSHESLVPIYLDPASPQQASRHSLVGAEVITPNALEAGALTGRSLHDDSTTAAAAADLAALGVRRAVLKLGPAGALFVADGSISAIPTAAVAAVDETGAGDVFVAALAIQRAGHVGWVEAIQFANAAAAVSISRPGLSLPGFDEVAAVATAIGPQSELL